MSHPPRRTKGKYTHVPGCRDRKTDYGHTVHTVRCADRHEHPYLNEGVPEHAMPNPVYSACPGCGQATAALIGTVGKLCDDCRSADAALWIESVGVQVITANPMGDRVRGHGEDLYCREPIRNGQSPRLRAAFAKPHK